MKRPRPPLQADACSGAPVTLIGLPVEMVKVTMSNTGGAGRSRAEKQERLGRYRRSEKVPVQYNTARKH